MSLARLFSKEVPKSTVVKELNYFVFGRPISWDYMVFYKCGSYSNTHTTIGVDFSIERITIDGQAIKLKISNSAYIGDRVEIANAYIQRTDQYLLFLEIGDKDENLDTIKNNFIEDLKRLSSLANKNGFILVGIQSHLRGSTPEIALSYDECKKLAKEYGALAYFECSPYQENSVNDVFIETTRMVLSRLQGKVWTPKEIKFETQSKINYQNDVKDQKQIFYGNQEEIKKQIQALNTQPPSNTFFTDVIEILQTHILLWDYTFQKTLENNSNNPIIIADNKRLTYYLVIFNLLKSSYITCQILNSPFFTNDDHTLTKIQNEIEKVVPMIREGFKIIANLIKDEERSYKAPGVIKILAHLTPKGVMDDFFRTLSEQMTLAQTGILEKETTKAPSIIYRTRHDIQTFKNWLLEPVEDGLKLKAAKDCEKIFSAIAQGKELKKTDDYITIIAEDKKENLSIGLDKKLGN